ncbi:MAG: PLP-dependent aminotransferase family protein [Bryobacteraceae bacterium]
MLTGIHLDGGLEAPLYRQLFEQIRQRIALGVLVVGERIPPTRELAEQLGLNRTTVSAAYELLEKEGLIRGHVGRGSFVQGAPAPAEELKAPGPAAEPRISFLASRPPEELFPGDEFRETVREVMAAGDLGSILQLGSPLGYEPLRRHLLAQWKQGGEELLVTNGCQQALDLIQRALVSPGDAVAVEDPVYPGLREAFQRGGARAIGWGNLAELEHVLRRDRPRLIAVTPSFQNPTGRTLSLGERRDVVRLAAQQQTLLVEVDIYSALRYEGEALPTLKDLAAPDGVVQVGSYSKVAFPGLRVGWMRGPRALIARMAEAKRWADLHTDHLAQAILLRFEESGRLEEHRRRVVTAGRERLAALLDACAQWFPAEVQYSKPAGGMSVWVRLPESVDTADLARRASREGVGFLPGSYFAVTRSHANCLRLSFAGTRPEAIREGVQILGGLFRDEMARPAFSMSAGSAAVVV